MNTIEFPKLAEVEQQSAAWVAAMDRGLTEDEKLALELWLQASPLHAETLVHFASIWDVLDVLKPIENLLPLQDFSIDPEQNIAELADQAIADKAVSRRFPTWVFATAASLLVGLGLYLALPQLGGNVEPVVISGSRLSDSAVFSNTYTTAVGQSSSLNLPDGSVVRLNTNSELYVTFSNTERLVNLRRGEAFFQVAKNPQLPFRVLAENSSITALGTAFNVEISVKHEMQLVVTEGRVVLDRVDDAYQMKSNRENRATKEAVYMRDGEQIVVRESGDRSSVQQSEDVDSLLAWRDGMLVFEGQPLSEAIDEINRYTPVKFRIVDASISSIPVGGLFRAGDLAQLQRVLEHNFSIKSQRVGSRIELSHDSAR